MKTTTRAYLLGSTLLVSTAMAIAPASAQTTTQVDAAVQEPPQESIEGDIVVTGTLIRNPNLTASSPVTVVTSDEISLRGSQTAEQVLRQTPGVVPDQGSAVNNGATGTSNVNLRSLGSQRNLVLLDGNRLVPSSSDGTVDLNIIPLALMQRVDVLTGGASATYGADAIGGVVNFITRTDFAGLDASASQQITERGDGNYFRADVAVGANFDDGRGNAVLAVGYQESDPIFQGARDFSTFSINSTTGRGSGASPTSTPTAVAFNDPDASFLQVNAGGTALVDQYQGFNFNPFNLLQLPFKKYNIYGAANYEVSDTIEVYTRGLFSQTTSTQIVAPSGIFAVGLDISSNNPFLTQGIRTQLCALQYDVDGNPTPPANCTATSSELLNLPAVYRRLVELGPRVDVYKYNTFDYTAGVRVNVTSSIKLDVSGAYGESSRRHDFFGYTLNDRFQQALISDPANPAQCADTSNGCVVLNLFGPPGSITPEQAAFLQGNNTDLLDSSLSQAKAILTGDFGYTSPFAAQPIGFAIGAEYRSYSFAQNPGPFSEQGILGGSGGPVTRYAGSYDVKEAYGELIAPIVADRPFFNLLQLEGGVRYSSYTVDAPGNPTFDTTTWKAGGQYEPFEGLRFRGDYQRAVRAPNIIELFSPVSTGLTNLNDTDDPCFGAAPRTNANLAAICIAQGAPATRVNNGTVAGPPAQQANVTSGGNPNIRPEVADTYTLGVVIQPRSFVPGLTITLDYYNIKLNGAISSPTPQDVLDGCFTTITAASAASPSCLAIERSRVNGAIGGDPNTVRGFITTLTNSGRITTDGFDLNLNYTRDLGFANLNLNFAGNYTMSSTFRSDVSSPVSVTRECTGFYSANCSAVSGSIVPEFYWNARATFGLSGADLSVLWRHVDAVDYEPGLTPLFNGTITGAGPIVGRSYNFNHIDAYNYIDLATRFQVADHFDLTITINNLFDKDPPVVGAGAGSTSFNSGNTFPSTYDTLGRTFVVGARVHF